MSGKQRIDRWTLLAVCGLTAIFAASHLAGLFGPDWARWLPFAGGAAAVVGLCWILDQRTAARIRLAAALGGLPDRAELAALAETQVPGAVEARTVLDALEAASGSAEDAAQAELGRAVFDHFGEAMMQVSAGGCVLALNAAGQDLVAQPEFAVGIDSLDPAEFVGMPVARFAPTLDAALQAADTAPADVELTIGATVYRVNVQVIRGRDDEAAGYLLKWTDATQSHCASIIVRALMDTQAMMELDADGLLVDANDGLATLAGRSGEDLIGRPFRDFVQGDPASRDELDEIWRGMDDGRALTGLLCLPTEAGGDVFLRATFTPVLDAAGALASVVVTAVDVTAILSDRRAWAGEREALMAAQQKAVQSLEVALQELAGGNLSQQIAEPFTEGLEALRLSFNTAAETLHWALGSVHVEAGKVDDGSGAISRTTEVLVSPPRGSGSAMSWKPSGMYPRWRNSPVSCLHEARAPPNRPAVHPDAPGLVKKPADDAVRPKRPS